MSNVSLLVDRMVKVKGFRVQKVVIVNGEWVLFKHYKKGRIR